MNKNDKIYKNNFGNGDILAFSDNSIIGMIVRTFTLSKIVHVGIIYNNFLFEALPTGVTLTPIEQALKRKGHIYHCSLNALDRKITNKNMIFFDGFVYREDLKAYDFNGAIWLGVDNLFKIFGKAESPDTLFCSELVIETRKAIGLMDKCVKSACWSPNDVVKKIKYANIKKIV